MGNAEMTQLIREDRSNNIVLEKMENYPSTMMRRIVLVCCIMALPLAHSRCFDVEKWAVELPQTAAVPLAYGIRVHESSPEEVEKWFQDLPLNANRKLAKLHFYVHDNVTAKNPTAVLVAPANSTSSQASASFGATYVMDDPITVSPDPSSKMISRAQGVFTFRSQIETVLSMAVTMVFTEGNYNGSTLWYSRQQLHNPRIQGDANIRGFWGFSIGPWSCYHKYSYSRYCKTQ